MTNLHAMKKSKVSFPQFWQQFFLHNLSMMYMFVYSPWCTSGCPWSKATVKRPVWNPGPKIEIPHPKSHVLKVFRFRSWKPRVRKCRPQSSDPKSWKHSSGSGSGPVTTQRVAGQTDGQTDSRSTADTKRKQRIKMKQRAPVVAINWLLKHPLGDFRNELQ